MSINTTRTANPTVVVGQLLGYTQYAPATNTIFSTTSTSLADIDATNLIVTFTVPTSGKVLVRLSAYGDISSNAQQYFWALRTTVPALVSGASIGPMRTGDGGPLSGDFILTGLTPGTVTTWRWAHGATGGATGRIFAGPGVTSSTVSTSNMAQSAVMEVWDAGVLSSWVNSVSYPGRVVQVQNTVVTSVATGSTQIPLDDTIPQITEGDEYMTLAITPTSSSNKLRIDTIIQLSNATADRWLAAALFQDATASALSASVVHVNIAGAQTIVSFTHYMTAGTTSSTTFRVRAGANNTGTTTFNGASGTRRFGGVTSSSITITEIIP